MSQPPGRRTLAPSLPPKDAGTECAALGTQSCTSCPGEHLGWLTLPLPSTWTASSGETPPSNAAWSWTGSLRTQAQYKAPSLQPGAGVSLPGQDDASDMSGPPRHNGRSSSSSPGGKKTRRSASRGCHLEHRMEGSSVSLYPRVGSQHPTHLMRRQVVGRGPKRAAAFAGRIPARVKERGGLPFPAGPYPAACGGSPGGSHCRGLTASRRLPGAHSPGLRAGPTGTLCPQKAAQVTDGWTYGTSCCKHPGAELDQAGLVGDGGSGGAGALLPQRPGPALEPAPSGRGPSHGGSSPSSSCTKNTPFGGWGGGRGVARCPPPNPGKPEVPFPSAKRGCGKERVQGRCLPE